MKFLGKFLLLAAWRGGCANRHRQVRKPATAALLSGVDATQLAAMG